MATMPDRAALLFDADNFNDPDQMRAVHGQFAQRVGKGFICHAHGAMSVWQRSGFKEALADIGGRFMPGLPLDKNTTDANLIIDALMLHFQQGVRRFGIASGDADFAPLAVQLRELGCDVAGYSRHAIAFNRMTNYYDCVVRFDVPPVKQEEPRVVMPKIIVPVPIPALDAAPTLVVPKSAPPVVAKPPPASESESDAFVVSPQPPASKIAAPAPQPRMPAELQRVLKLVPALRNQAQALSVIIPVLKRAGLVSAKPGDGAKWFRQWPQWVELSPPQQPNHVALTAKARKSMQAAPKMESTPKTPQPAVPAVKELREPLAARVKLVSLPPHLHALRHVLYEVRYLKVTPLEVLQAATELVRGDRISLGSLGARLRAKGLIDSGHSAMRVLRHMDRAFEVSTESLPQWVRYKG